MHGPCRGDGCFYLNFTIHHVKELPTTCSHIKLFLFFSALILYFYRCLLVIQPYLFKFCIG